jgi:hypothetical protein
MPVYTIHPPIKYGPTLLLYAATQNDCGYSLSDDGIYQVEIPEDVAAHLEPILAQDGYMLSLSSKEEL